MIMRIAKNSIALPCPVLLASEPPLGLRGAGPACAHRQPSQEMRGDPVRIR